MTLRPEGSHVTSDSSVTCVTCDIVTEVSHVTNDKLQMCHMLQYTDVSHVTSYRSVTYYK